MARAVDALAAVMVHPSVVKVGWGLSGDLAKVAASHLYLLRPLHIVEPILDLRDALATLTKAAGVAAPAELCAAADASGLSNAVREVLGGRLSKKEQGPSRWGDRRWKWLVGTCHGELTRWRTQAVRLPPQAELCQSHLCRHRPSPPRT